MDEDPGTPAARTRTEGPATATSLTSTAQAAARPRSRLLGIDAARGLAIVGMIVVNVGPTNAETVLERLYLLPFGRASVLFVTIAGIGMGLFLGRRQGAALWSPLAWRVLLLLAVGLVLQTLTSSVSVILTTYALLFLTSPLLQRLSRRALLSVAAVLLVAGPVWIVADDVTSPGTYAKQGVTLTTPPGETLHSLFLSGPYPLASWTVPFVVGLAVARLDLSRTRVQRRLAVWGAVAAVGAQLVATVSYDALGSRADTGWLRLLTGVAHGQMPLWLVSATGGAVLVVAVCVAVGQRTPALLRWPAVLGRYALTVYVAHVLVLAVVKPPDGLPSFALGALISALMVTVFVVGAVLWDRTGRQGPLEWVLRHPWLRRRGHVAAPPAAGGRR